jgi:hypothetical protein
MWARRSAGAGSERESGTRPDEAGGAAGGTFWAWEVDALDAASARRTHRIACTLDIDAFRT